jgi:hypothetical protein
MDNLEKSAAILGATQQGIRLSPRDLDIVRVAQSVGLSASAQEEFDARYLSSIATKRPSSQR